MQKLPRVALLLILLAVALPAAADVSEVRDRRTGPELAIIFEMGYVLDSEGELLIEGGALVPDPLGPSSYFSVDNASASPALEVRFDIYDSTGVYLAAFTRTISDPLAPWVGRRRSFPLSALFAGAVDLCGDGGFEIPWNVLGPLVGVDGVARGFLIMRPVIGCSTAGPDDAVLDCEDETATPDCKGISSEVFYTQGSAAQSFAAIAPQWGTHTIPFVGAGVFEDTGLLVFGAGPDLFEITVTGFAETGDQLTFGSSDQASLSFDVGGARPFLLKRVNAQLEPSQPVGDLVITHPEGTLIWVIGRRYTTEDVGFSVGSHALVTRGEP